MDSGLHTVERSIAATSPDQILMGPILDEASRINRDNPVSTPNSRQPMGNYKNGPAFDDLLHVLLDHSLAFVIKRARCFVEDQDSRVGDQRARDCDSLPLPPDRLEPRSPTIVSYPSGSSRMNA